MERYFRVSPASVHQMVLRLEEKEYIERVPGAARSVRVLVSPEDIPQLQ